MSRGESLDQAIADESRSALDAYVCEGARQMLQRALECEVDASERVNDFETTAERI